MKYYLNKDLETSKYTYIYDEFFKENNCHFDSIEMNSLSGEEKVIELINKINGDSSIIFYDFSSLKISLDEFWFLYKQLKTNNIDIYFYNEDSNFLEILLNVIKVDKWLLSERVKRGIDEAKKNGIVVGRPMIEKDIASQIIYLHQTERLSFRRIAKECNVSIGTVHKYIHKKE